jgi:hypothetical protein
VIKSVDREQVRQAVLDYAEGLRNQHTEIVRVIWFGSWVAGLPAPGSGVDLSLILYMSNKPPRDPASDYLPLGFPVGVDLFAYTQDEFKRLKETNPGWFQAITSGTDI